jgi:hypothetical protein
MRVRGGRVNLGTALAVTAGAVACRQIVGISGNPPGALGPVCGLTYPANACAECVSASCCSESTSCAASSVCAPRETCLAGCDGDLACRGRCIIENPVGTTPETPAIDACLASNCQSACNLPPCGGLGSLLSPPDDAVGCEQCLADNNACTAGTTCAASLACNTFFECVQSCFTYDCRQACANAYGTESSIAPAGNAWNGPCRTQCAYGQDWSCVGHVSWPSPKAATSELRLLIADTADGTKGLPGLIVSYCHGGDDTCTDSPQVTNTDSTGIATFQISLAPSDAPEPYANYFQIVSNDESSEMIVPELLFFGFPPSEPEWEQIQQSASEPLFVTGPALVVKTTELPSFSLPAKPGTGYIAAVTIDCLSAYAPGVEVATVPPASEPPHYYASVTQKATALPFPVAVFTSIPPGYPTVIATPVVLDKPSSSVPVLVREGYITAVLLGPTPDP